MTRPRLWPGPRSTGLSLQRESVAKPKANCSTSSFGIKCGFTKRRLLLRTRKVWDGQHLQLPKAKILSAATWSPCLLVEHTYVKYERVALWGGKGIIVRRKSNFGCPCSPGQPLGKVRNHDRSRRSGGDQVAWLEGLKDGQLPHPSPKSPSQLIVSLEGVTRPRGRDGPLGGC